jgi:hypothetical protein
MYGGVPAWIDQEDAHVTATIRQHGWLISYIHDCENPDAPAFAYTVGLFGLHHPELLLFDVDPDTASLVLNALGGRIRRGGDLVPGRVVTVRGWSHRIVPEEVPNPDEIVFEANRFYQRAVAVLQLTYDDRCGRFPWEPGYDSPHIQPRPGGFAAF